MKLLLLLNLYFSSVFFYRDIKADSFNLDIFTPFVNYAWIIIILSMILFGCILKLFSNWEQTNLEFTSAIILSFGIYCQQSVHYKFSMISSGCLMFFIFLSTFLVYNFYTSTLLSATVNMKNEQKIRNLEELGNSDLDVGFYDFAGTGVYLRVSLNCQSSNHNHSKLKKKNFFF